MNIKIRSRTALPKILEEALLPFIEKENDLSISFLFPVLEEEQEQIIDQVKSLL